MTTALIKNYYDAFNRKDWDAMLSCLDEDVLHESNQGLPAYGKANFREFLHTMAHHYDEQLEELVLFATAQPDRFAAECICLGSYLKSQAGLPEAKGQKYRVRVGAFFSLNASGTKIVRVTNYYNLSDWIKQVSSR